MLFYFLKLNMPGILPKVEPELLTVFFLVAMLKAKMFQILMAMTK
jgi:hypothetical protein